MGSKAFATAISVVAIAALAACGDDDNDKPAASAGTTATAKAAPKVAPELIGTWKAKVPLSEIPDLQSGDMPLGPDWEIAVLEAGGSDGGPRLSYVNNKAEVSGDYDVKVAGDRITVTDTNCSSGTAKSVYSFTVNGDKLTFKPVESHCADQVLDDLLSARPWRRV